MRLLNYIDINEPKIIKEKNELIWISREIKSHYNSDNFTYIYQNEWYEKYFKEETIQFAKVKAEKEIKANSVFEFILSQLNYLEEEKERQKEYINEKYHDNINKINYQYF